MDRRYFLRTALAGALGCPRLATAQPSARVRRLGWLSPFVGPRPTFRDAMRELGYVEGKTFVFETRLAEGKYDRLPALAAELVSMKVDLIVAVAPAAVRATKEATKSIPIVIAWWGGPDLVESGVVASFARPGGNITGVHMLSVALDEKRLELLLQAVPAARRIAVLTHEGILFEPMLAPIRKAAAALAVQLHTIDVGEAGGYEGTFDAMAQKGSQALLVVASPKFDPDRKRIFALAARRRIPAMYGWDFFAAEGGLMGYGPSRAEMDRRAASLVDKILKGANPGNLPIEQPTKFELGINLKVARALGLTIPQSLLLRADQVIE
jgi:putative tryptophan/tyrosine transport system substrate-binding protein